MDLYEHPDNLFVAGFIGSPRMNFLKAEVVEASADGAVVRTAAGDTLTVAVDAARAKPGDPVTLGVRPEHLTLKGEDNALTARADFVETLGHATYAYLAHDAAEEGITCQLPGDVRPKAGEALTVHVPAALAHLFDVDGEAFRRIG